MTSGAIVAISVASLATTVAFVCAAARALAIALQTRAARNGTGESARMEAARADDQQSSHPAFSEADVAVTGAEDGANDSPSLSVLAETLDYIVGELRVVQRSNQSIQLLLLQSIGPAIREPKIHPRKMTGSRYLTATEYFKPGDAKSSMQWAISEQAFLAAMKNISDDEEIA